MRAGRQAALHRLREAHEPAGRWGLPGAGAPSSALPGAPAPCPAALPLHGPSKGLLGRRGRSSMRSLIYSSYFNRLLESIKKAAGQCWAQLAERSLLTAPSLPNDRSPRTRAAGKSLAGGSSWPLHASPPRRGGISVLSRLLHPLAASSCCLGFFPPPPLGFTDILLCRRSSGRGSGQRDSPAAKPEKLRQGCWEKGHPSTNQPCGCSRPLQHP